MRLVLKTAIFVAVLMSTISCSGEKKIYKGTLTTTIEMSGSGDYVGSGNDEVDVTVTKYSEDEMAINFKTAGDGKIKTEMESCTLKMFKSGSDWAENGSKKCTAGGQDYQILKGTGVMSGKDLRLSFEAVPFGTGKTNKYRFEGIGG
jgi:hypothetical protein